MTHDLLTRDRLAERQGGIWDYVSPSRLNTWLACPLKFRLKYIDGVKSPTTRAVFIGKAVHYGLECYYRHRQLGLWLSTDEVTVRLADHWGEAVAAEEMSFDSIHDEQACRRQAQTLVAGYLNQLPAQEPRPLAVEVALESPLVDPNSGEDLGIPMVGIVDLILPEIAGPLIIDFKTASRNSDPPEIVYEIQLSAYAYLFRYVHPAREGGLEIRQLIKTTTPQYVLHRYPTRTDAHFRRLFAVVRAYLDDLDSGRFFVPAGAWVCDV